MRIDITTTNGILIEQEGNEKGFGDAVNSFSFKFDVDDEPKILEIFNKYGAKIIEIDTDQE